MEVLERIKLPVQLGAFTVIGLWTQIPTLTQFLIVMMAVDIIFGVAVAIKQKNISPSRLAWGVTKKAVSLMLVSLGWVFHFYVNADFGFNMGQAASAFYLAAEFLSISRNAILLDVMVPPQFQTMIAYFEGFSKPKEKEEGDHADTTTP